MSEKNFSDHAYFLGLALAQAKQRQGFCAPNPSVGAVAVSHDQVLGQACHERAGMPHAEAVLLAQIPPGIPHLVVYVTLEPCHHWGKTPPCVDAIIDYGVETVVFAYRDPNRHLPLQDSVTLLEARGVKVIHFPMPEIDAFYQSYCHWLATGLPWVRAKWAQSFDGKLGYPGQRVQLSNQEAQRFTHEQRLRADVILSSAATIKIDDPQFNVRLNQQTHQKPLAVVDRYLSLSGHETIFKTTKLVHIFHLPHLKPSWSFEHVYFHAIEDFDNLGLVLKKIAELGYHELWLEAGPRLLQSMHRQGFVHESFVMICPKILGKLGLTALEDEDFFESLARLSSQSLGDDILVHLEWERD